jgi:hypothetical protein
MRTKYLATWSFATLLAGAASMQGCDGSFLGGQSDDPDAATPDPHRPDASEPDPQDPPDASEPDPQDPPDADLPPPSDDCSDWKVGTLTGYNNSDEGDDPNSGNLMEFTGLTAAFYANVAIASIDLSDWGSDKYHWVDINFNGVVRRVGTWDACRNADCPGGGACCTENKERFATPGYLLDLETRTAKRLFGVQDAENTLQDRIEYRVCGEFDPDAIANPYGVYRE